MKLNFAIRHLSRRTHPRGHKRDTISPERDWLIALLVTGALFIGVGAYAGYDFYDQYTDAGDVDVEEESVPRYRKDEADRILEYYTGRVRTFEELRAQRPLKTTPSLIAPTSTGVGLLPEGGLIAQ